MATVSTLSVAERVVLPFSGLIPFIVGYVNYKIWKWDRHQGGAGKPAIISKLTVLTTASSAILIGQVVFHVLKDVMSTEPADPRVGLGAFGLAFVVFMALSFIWEHLQVSDDDILFDDYNEVADTIILDQEGIIEYTGDIESQKINIKRRRVVSVLVYSVISFQSVFDGLVLKYNPNAMESGVQVAMFFVQKVLESVVITTTLIHARVRTRWYIAYMVLFAASVVTSAFAAFEFVSPIVVVLAYEHPVFQACLGASGGVLLMFAIYFVDLEARRRRKPEYYRNSKVLSIVAFSSAFVFSAMTGIFG